MVWRRSRPTSKWKMNEGRGISSIALKVALTRKRRGAMELRPTDTEMLRDVFDKG